MAVKNLPFSDRILGNFTAGLSGSWVAFFQEIFRLLNARSYYKTLQSALTVTGITGLHTVSGEIVQDRSFTWVNLVITPTTTIDLSDIEITGLTPVTLDVPGIIQVVRSASMPEILATGLFYEDGSIKFKVTASGVSEPIVISGQFLNTFSV